MNKKLITIFAATALIVLSAVAGWSQMLARVHGKCIGVEGIPMVGITVQFHNADTGQNYDLKTDSKGEFASIAISPGKYTVNLIQDGKIIHYYTGIGIKLDEQATELAFDLQKEIKDAQKNPEYQKKTVEATKENEKIGKLNKMLTDASADGQAGNWQQAIQVLNDALAMDATHDVIWAHLGDAEYGAGTAAASKDEATPHFDKSVEAYKKAIELAQATPASAGADKKPVDNKAIVGKYHNNLGQTYAKSGRPKEALDEYTTAAENDVPNAAMYYFNAGATLTNIATKESDAGVKQKDIDEANSAFDKAIVAKPDYAEAYYQKGINLTSMATIDKSGKMVPAPGTIEAFNKYLELEPEGKHVEEAKGLIEGFGATVTTTYKKAKATTPTKSKSN
ncbi:MAG TPA: hypothetical protein VK699_14340 [Terriglobales bacterium]|nr:hypothetical protein [Terriglobales bacterium]